MSRKMSLLERMEDVARRQPLERIMSMITIGVCIIIMCLMQLQIRSLENEKAELISKQVVINLVASGSKVKELTDTAAEPMVQTVATVYTTPFTIEEMEMLAKVVYREARGVYERSHQAAVIWCILNRVDAGYGTIEEVITAPNQFEYYENTPMIDDYGRDIIALVNDVGGRWSAEKAGAQNVGRVLPNDYLWFYASSNGVDNVFRNAYSEPYTLWDWYLLSPYAD